jgi:preprotein translocase subunit SecG
MTLLIYLLTAILLFTSVFLVFVVLMQRAKTDGGIGAAMGGGSMESTFGAETGNVLSKATINAAVIFFVVSFALYLAHIYQSRHLDVGDNRLPTVMAPATTSAPAAVTPAPQPATPQPGEPKK